MYAVIKTGGKQYRVTKDDVLAVELLGKVTGETVEFADVLMVGSGADVKLGTPRVEGARVMAEVVDTVRTDKVIIMKKRKRQTYRRKGGHRQSLTMVKITDITG